MLPADVQACLCLCFSQIPEEGFLTSRPILWTCGGAQWLSGRVLDLRPRVRGFEPHRHHCIVVLEQDALS